MNEKVKNALQAAKPTPKVAAGINWGAFAFIFASVIAWKWPDIYKALPAGFELQLGMFLGSLATTLGAWWKRERV